MTKGCATVNPYLVATDADAHKAAKINPVKTKLYFKLKVLIRICNYIGNTPFQTFL
jgi:hypothetical protein